MERSVVNGQLRTAPEWEARGDDLEAAAVNSVEDAARMAIFQSGKHHQHSANELIQRACGR